MRDLALAELAIRLAQSEYGGIFCHCATAWDFCTELAQQSKVSYFSEGNRKLSGDSSSDEEAIVLAMSAYELIKYEPSFWVHLINLNREKVGESFHLFPDLKVVLCLTFISFCW